MCFKLQLGKSCADRRALTKHPWPSMPGKTDLKYRLHNMESARLALAESNGQEAFVVINCIHCVD